MRERHLLPLAGAALALVLAGCLAPSSGGPDLEASASVDDATLEPGEWVNVTYHLTNRGEADYTYKHPGCPPARVDATARGPGPAVELYRYRNDSLAGTCMIRNVTVEAGETLSGTVNWNGRADGDAPDPHDGSRVPAGTYTVTAELVRADDGPTFPANVTVEVRG